MLAEWLEHLFTPCSNTARKLGYLREMIALKARHARVGQAWAGHLENSKRFTLESANLDSSRECAMILGSGLLYDVPLDSLAASFKQVYLVDMLHLPGVRKLAGGYANVRFLELDVSGICAHPLGLPGPGRARQAALETAKTLRDLKPTFAVSLNLLSQLPQLPLEALRRAKAANEARLEDLARELLSGHLEQLCGLECPFCLIADSAWLARSREIEEREDPCLGMKLPEPDASWEWLIAPRPEESPGYDRVNLVAAFARSAGSGLSFSKE